MLSEPASAARFGSTHWSLVLAAGDSASISALPALQSLCSTYWPPLYAFARRLGNSREDARDLTQGFFARLIEKNWLSDADASRGRFRTFLLTAFKRYLADESDRAHAAKRGGGTEFVPIHSSEDAELWIDPEDGRTPESIYEERWAATLIDSVLERLRSEQTLQGRERIFDALRPFLLGEPLQGGLNSVLPGIGLTEGAARMNLTRLRQRYRQLLRSEIAATVSTVQEVEEELRHLYRVASQSERH